MIKRIATGIFILISISCFSQKILAEDNGSTTISNKYFSVVMPKETKNTYVVSKNNKAINIIEKISHKRDEGGFAFGIEIYKNQQEYADLEDRIKIGELVDKMNSRYDVILNKPTEIIYSEGETVADNYNRLYNLSKNIEIKGINGSKYYKGQGAKGESLYGETLREYKKSLEQKNTPNKIGYAYYDINKDGIDELFIGKILKGKYQAHIYAIYTSVDRKVKLVTSNKENEQLHVSLDTYIRSESSNKSGKKSIILYTLKKYSADLNPYISLIYDKKASKNGPYFVSYGSYGRLKEISKKDFNERKNYFTDYMRFNYIPLSEVK